MAPTVTQSGLDSLLPYLILYALVAVWTLFLVGLILALRKRRMQPPSPKTVTLVVLVIGFAAMSALLGYGALAIYASRNTWTFSYSVSIMANGSEAESVVLPVPRDESLLADLHASSAAANWSFVDTPKGRGLDLHFTGSVVLDATVSRFLFFGAPPDTAPTMQDAANGSDPSRIWVYYPGGAGGRVDLAFTSWYAQVFLVPGWTSVAMWPILPPVA